MRTTLSTYLSTTRLNSRSGLARLAKCGETSTALRVIRVLDDSGSVIHGSSCDFRSGVWYTEDGRRPQIATSALGVRRYESVTLKLESVANFAPGVYYAIDCGLDWVHAVKNGDETRRYGEINVPECVLRSQETP